MVNLDERTVQLEGITDEPTGPDLDRLKELYFARFPDGRDRQHGAVVKTRQTLFLLGVCGAIAVLSSPLLRWEGYSYLVQCRRYC
jgi:hypothetical protein